MLLTTDAQIRDALSKVKRVAVVGAKAEDGPARSIPLYLHEQGFDVVPVSPRGEQIGPLQAVTSLAAAGAVDLVVFFRRGDAMPGHQSEVLDAAPALAWMQLGIRNDDVAQAWSQAGIDVVQDRCVMVEHRRLFS